MSWSVGAFLYAAGWWHHVSAIGRIELWVAFAAWAAVFVAMAVHVTRTVLLPERERMAA